MDLTTEVLTLAVCVLLEKPNGDVLGFTTFDRDIDINGQIYEATDGVLSSVIRQNLGLTPGDLEIEGSIGGFITEKNIVSGVYSGTKITIFMVDWENPSSFFEQLLHGDFGQVEIRDRRYNIEIRDMLHRYSQQIGELTSPVCRVKHLGDERCKINIEDYRFDVHVTSVLDDGKTLIFSSDAHATGYFNYGEVKFTSGDNENYVRGIKTHELSGSEAVITLNEIFPYTVDIDDFATLEAGCDRTFGTCRIKFNNTINFRGEPYLPGNANLFERGDK